MDADSALQALLREILPPLEEWVTADSSELFLRPPAGTADVLDEYHLTAVTSKAGKAAGRWNVRKVICSVVLDGDGGYGVDRPNKAVGLHPSRDAAIAACQEDWLDFRSKMIDPGPLCALLALNAPGMDPGGPDLG